jgi:ketosteroid isomerase-like protein
MSVETVVLQFVDAINTADLERLAALMTEGHVFIDSDYRVVVNETYGAANTTVLVLAAMGRDPGREEER